MTKVKNNKVMAFCSFGLVVLILIGLFMQPASAATAVDGFYTFNKTQFEQGISAVECVNSVDREVYTQLWTAVNNAILDWDWHLGLLNTWYGVDWNMYKVSEESIADNDYPEIEIRTLTSSQFESEFPSVEIDSNTLGVTRWYKPTSIGSRTPIIITRDNWTSTEVILLTDVLQNKGHLNDYETLKTITNHELGHCLGLAHDTEDTGVIMHNNYSTITATVPTRRDLETVYYIYGN